MSKNVEEYWLSYNPKGRGHFELVAIHKETQKKDTKFTTDTVTIDEAFNSEFDDECWYHDSIDDAKQCVLDKIFSE